MIRTVGRGLLALFLTALPALAEDLTATLPDGTELARLTMPDGAGWCVLWHHSVQGFEVQDCYRNQEGRMVLERSHQPDFAAGLGHLPGRGQQISDGAGGYWIEDIGEPVPGDAYLLRPGTMAVNHRIVTSDRDVSLSALAPRARVLIALQPGKTE
ncbi:DUF1850 domain-containing protein [Primorskyibacter flagellatus]|uniref:DUF1850 domain-containing protein n=1 Tax=Primorskyibacter flagellatus TaxID=1387277 RepID=A0A1W2DDE5_9RHOB|nr:DUF1850 domain-containing protein [Primorskyibacter flagellatus]SMC95569.1 protein of unknown function [Primorskyibacter flagellatus]